MEDLTVGRRGEGIRDHGLPLLMAGAGFGGKDFLFYFCNSITVRTFARREIRGAREI